jgi:hypothetical protein
MTPSAPRNGRNGYMLTLCRMRGAWSKFHPCALYMHPVDGVLVAICVQRELTEETERQDCAMLACFLDSCAAGLGDAA